MCGRYVSPDQAGIEREWHVGRHNVNRPFKVVYNTAPTQRVPILRRSATDGVLELAEARWGLIPHWWSKPEPPTFSTINARSEEAAGKPFWRDPWRNARCLIPAVGWYEWQAGEPVRGKRPKLPFYLTRADGRLAAFAGLLASWTSPATGEVVQSCAILTRAPSPSAAEVHDRMPVILDRAVQDEWMDPAMRDTRRVAALVATGIGEVKHHRVATTVNRASAEGPELIEPIDE